MVIIISSSLNPGSNSRILAHEALDVARSLKIEAMLVDLRDYPLTLCDGEASFDQSHAEALAARLRQAAAVLFASPIYNYDVSAALKNLIEHVGGELSDKVVGMMCAAGGERSYMSALPFLNSLMLDYRSLVIPRFVYASRSAFENGVLVDSGVKARVQELVVHTERISQVLSDIRPQEAA